MPTEGRPDSVAVTVATPGVLLKSKRNTKNAPFLKMYAAKHEDFFIQISCGHSRKLHCNSTENYTFVLFFHLCVDSRGIGFALCGAVV